MMEQQGSRQLENQNENTKSTEARNLINKIKIILSKNYENRSLQDHQIVLNFIKQNPVLFNLTQLVSLQFVKSLLKAARIVFFPKNVLLYNSGDKIQQMGILLTGKLAVAEKKGDQNGIIPTPVNMSEMIEKLLQQAKAYQKIMRKKQLNSSIEKQSKSKILHPDKEKQYSSFNESLSSNFTQQQALSYINPNEIIGFVERSTGEFHTGTCFTMEIQNAILLINESNIMISLEVALKEKIKKIASILKGISCFTILEKDKLQLLIQSMVLRRIKKGQSVYLQDEISNNFYLLVEGELKIMKETKLFEQNPNNLYANRKKLIEQSFNQDFKNVDKAEKIFLNKKIKKQTLPFANLTAIYNFRPITKKIQIGVVTSTSLFGEEEFSENKKRDASAVCSSITAQYFEINTTKLEQILGLKIYPNFKKELKNMVRKKVLYRQSQYATSVNLENNKNFNYFYLNEEKQLQSPRKYKITKLNNLITTSRNSTPRKPNNQQASMSATFTTFNFNKMGNLSRTERKNKHPENQSQQTVRYDEENPKQMKIMELTHTWKLVKQKVDMQIKASKKISPVKPTINLNKPLIASDYFYFVQKQSKRITRQHRKRVLSLGKNPNYTKSKQGSSIKI